MPPERMFLGGYAHALIELFARRLTRATLEKGMREHGEDYAI